MAAAASLSLIALTQENHCLVPNSNIVMSPDTEVWTLRYANPDFVSQLEESSRRIAEYLYYDEWMYFNGDHVYVDDVLPKPPQGWRIPSDTDLLADVLASDSVTCINNQSLDKATKVSDVIKNMFSKHPRTSEWVNLIAAAPQSHSPDVCLAGIYMSLPDPNPNTFDKEPPLPPPPLEITYETPASYLSSTIKSRGSVHHDEESSNTTHELKNFNNRMVVSGSIGSMILVIITCILRFSRFVNHNTCRRSISIHKNSNKREKERKKLHELQRKQWESKDVIATQQIKYLKQLRQQMEESQKELCKQVEKIELHNSSPVIREVHIKRKIEVLPPVHLCSAQERSEDVGPRISHNMVSPQEVDICSECKEFLMRLACIETQLNRIQSRQDNLLLDINRLMSVSQWSESEINVMINPLLDQKIRQLEGNFEKKLHEAVEKLKTNLRNKFDQDLQTRLKSFEGEIRTDVGVVERELKNDYSKLLRICNEKVHFCTGRKAEISTQNVSVVSRSEKSSKWNPMMAEKEKQVLSRVNSYEHNVQLNSELWNRSTNTRGDFSRLRIPSNNFERDQYTKKETQSTANMSTGSDQTPMRYSLGSEGLGQIISDEGFAKVIQLVAPPGFETFWSNI